MVKLSDIFRFTAKGLNVSETTLNDKYQINLLQRSVHFQGEEIKIRSKSFELLALFLAHPNELISKETMLSVIWDDVAVDEQVIFQSIKELRKAFGSIDAIKTFPRKGYQWIGDVNLVTQPSSVASSAKKTGENISAASVNQHNQSSKKLGLTKQKKALYLIVALSLLTLIGWSFKQWQNSNSHLKVQRAANYKPVDGSIIVLPVKEHINDRDHKWVRIGAMDQLIQQLPSSSEYGVMQVDDVLDIMKRAQLPLLDFGAEQVGKIFAVSGAELIIETELNGTPGDYQLIYTFRTRQNIERGVLLNADIYDGIDQLAKIVAMRLGIKAAPFNTYHNNLVNQLLAQALDRKNNDDYEATEQYLKSLLEIEPTNLKAVRLLAEVSAYLKKTKQIAALVTSVEALSATQSQLIASDLGQREYGRLKFWQGLNELQFGRTDQALAIFTEATIVANKAQDWLYLGYLAEAQGHLYRSTKQYPLARKFYQLAISQHKIIKCPFGEVNNLLYVAETAFLQNDLELAKTSTAKSLAIAQQRELTSLMIKAKDASAKYNALNN